MVDQCTKRILTEMTFAVLSRLATSRLLLRMDSEADPAPELEQRKGCESGDLQLFARSAEFARDLSMRLIR